MYVYLAQLKTTVVATQKMYCNTLLILVILSLVLNSCGQKGKKFFRKDYTFMEAFQSFYKMNAIPQAFADAKRMCAQEGAMLWHPDNEEEAMALLEFWNTTWPKIEWVYTGLNDLSINGVFKTIDGKSSSEVYINWEPDTPDNEGGNQHCVYMYLKEGPGYLDDYSCDERYSFICKKTIHSLEWNYKCNFPYLDYSYSRDNGRCYKLHTTPLNWTEAYVVCDLEESYLAVINNPREAAYLAKLTELTPKPRLKEKYQRGIFHVGFHNKLNEGWETVAGVRVNLDQKAWYDNYQPDDENQCGSMFYTGRLINTDCDMRSFFICEHEIENVDAPVSISDWSSFLEPYVGGGIY